MTKIEAQKREMMRRAEAIERSGMLTKDDWKAINARVANVVSRMHGELLHAYRAYCVVQQVGAVYGDEGV